MPRPHPRARRRDPGRRQPQPALQRLEPKNEVLLQWDHTAGFSIDSGGGNYWALGTGSDASSVPADLTATSGVFTFKFAVSEAMRNGTWAVLAHAQDMDHVEAFDSSTTATVDSYSRIATRTQKNFGAIAAGSSNFKTDIPNVMANGKTTLSLTASDFVSGSNTFQLVGGSPSAPPSDHEVTFDCSQTLVFVEQGATRVQSTATSLGTLTTTGLAEDGQVRSNACRIEHGGGNPYGTYSATIVNTVINAY